MRLKVVGTAASLLATVPAFLLAARIPFTHPDTEEVTAEEIDKELINE